MIVRDLSLKLNQYVRDMAGKSAEGILDSVTIGVPKNKKFGDLYTNAAMVMARPLGKNPLNIAQTMVKDLSEAWPQAEGLEIVKPGFINFKLKDSFLKSCLAEIITHREKYGRNQEGAQAKVNIEYVSSNPTGNSISATGRWGVLGDVLSSLYEANGYQVTVNTMLMITAARYRSLASVRPVCIPAILAGNMITLKTVIPRKQYLR